MSWEQVQGADLTLIKPMSKAYEISVKRGWLNIFDMLEIFDYMICKKYFT